MYTAFLPISIHSNLFNHSLEISQYYHCPDFSLSLKKGKQNCI